MAIRGLRSPEGLVAPVQQPRCSEAQSGALKTDPESFELSIASHSTFVESSISEKRSEKERANKCP